MPEDPALETLSITNYLCLATGSFQMHLSQSLNINQLKDLGLSAVDLTNVKFLAPSSSDSESRRHPPGPGLG